MLLSCIPFRYYRTRHLDCKIKCLAHNELNKLITTNDQSHSVLSGQFDQPYHSKFGAIQESLHVFIHAGLEEVIYDHPVINILEVGLGTGLNPLLTQIAGAKTKTKIRYTAIEAYPLDNEIYQQLNYAELLNVPKEILQQIHDCSWNVFHDLTEQFSFRKIKVKIEDWTPDFGMDAIYYDAFSPDVQPELWTEELFRKLFLHLEPHGLLTTYSAKGSVKRALKAAGFTIEKLAGPPGKREMTRAWVNRPV